MSRVLLLAYDHPIVFDRAMRQKGALLVMLSWDEVYRRAGGRRKYNALRRDRARWRRLEVVRLWGESAGRPGWQAAAARTLGVHRSTITKDMRTILAELNRPRRCPLCGHVRR